MGVAGEGREKGKQGIVEKSTLAKSQYVVVTNRVTDRRGVKKKNNKDKCLHDLHDEKNSE